MNKNALTTKLTYRCHVYIHDNIYQKIIYIFLALQFSPCGFSQTRFFLDGLNKDIHFTHLRKGVDTFWYCSSLFLLQLLDYYKPVRDVVVYNFLFSFLFRCHKILYMCPMLPTTTWYRLLLLLGTELERKNSSKIKA